VIRRIIHSDMAKMIMALSSVGIVSAVSLVFVYTYAMPKITENMKKAEQAGIKNLFPEAEKITATPIEGVFDVRGKNGKALGYAFTAAGNGYQGLIQVIAGVNTGITKMTGMEVLESQETPGLGAEIAGPFKDQFSALSVTRDIEYVKNKKPEQPYQVEAITGATISSRAVVNMLNDRIKDLRKNIKGQE
jgi:Na+-translocating ferredoxin:NAD+ oxidoreductase subunit G